MRFNSPRGLPFVDNSLQRLCKNLHVHSLVLRGPHHSKLVFARILADAIGLEIPSHSVVAERWDRYSQEFYPDFVTFSSEDRMVLLDVNIPKDPDVHPFLRSSHPSPGHPLLAYGRWIGVDKWLARLASKSDKTEGRLVVTSSQRDTRTEKDTFLEADFRLEGPLHSIASASRVSNELFLVNLLLPIACNKNENYTTNNPQQRLC